jgi:radical SAM superfamily enzyme YgiQ (UPF0313 family)
LAEHGLVAQVVDAHCWGLDLPETLECVAMLQPRVLGIQLIFHEQIPAAAQLAQRIKTENPETLIVAGGHVATFSAEDLLARVPQIDCVVRGEGERPFYEIVQRALRTPAESHRQAYADVPGVAYLAQGELVTITPGDLVEQLDELPFPYRDQRDYPEYRHASIIGSRGCYARCEFCSVPQFFKISKGPLWRLRSIENVIAEMEQLASSHQITHFSFVDDIFLGTDRRSHARAIRFAEEVSRDLPDIRFSIECRTDAVRPETFKALKAAGLERVFLGLEAGSDEGLRLLNKWSDTSVSLTAIDVLRTLDIAISFGFINFHPDATTATLKDNIEFLAALGFAYPATLCTRLNAYPGTPIWGTLMEAGRLHGDPLFPSYVIRAPNVECLYADFRSAFAARNTSERARKRAEFALSFLVDERSQISARYQQTCRTLSDLTSRVALEMTTQKEAGQAVDVLAWKDEFEHDVAPILAIFAEIEDEAAPYRALQQMEGTSLQ